MAVVDTTAPAMGTRARLYLSDAPSYLEVLLRARLSELEMRWSRFVPTSDVSRLNGADGRSVVVSADTMMLASRALDAVGRCGIWFDPLLLGELVDAGYDRSFERLEPAAPVLERPGPGNPLRHARAAVEDLTAAVDRSTQPPSVRILERRHEEPDLTVDPATSTVRVDRRRRFDPGGIGKGLAADLLAATAIDHGAAAAMIDLGGDIVCAGRAPEGGWPVGIEDPFQPGGELARIAIPWGAVATSSRARRRWMVDGDVRHHLIDPTSGLPSTSSLVSVTVVAGACWLAEACAKAALIAGPDEGMDLLVANGVEALFVHDSGAVSATAAMAALVGCPVGPQPNLPEHS